jgi:hypothetical protein
MPGNLPSHSQKNYSSQAELNNNWTKVSSKELDQHKRKPKEKPNTTKKANTGSSKLPLPVATQLFQKRKVKTAESRFLDHSKISSNLYNTLKIYHSYSC